LLLTYFIDKKAAKNKVESLSANTPTCGQVFALNGSRHGHLMVKSRDNIYITLTIKVERHQNIQATKVSPHFL